MQVLSGQIICHYFLIKTNHGRNLLVIETTSEAHVLESLGFRKAFGITFHVPTLRRPDTKKVFIEQFVINQGVVQ